MWLRYEEIRAIFNINCKQEFLKYKFIKYGPLISQNHLNATMGLILKFIEKIIKYIE